MTNIQNFVLSQNANARVDNGSVWFNVIGYSLKDDKMLDVFTKTGEYGDAVLNCKKIAKDDDVRTRAILIYDRAKDTDGSGREFLNKHYVHADQVVFEYED